MRRGRRRRRIKWLAEAGHPRWVSRFMQPCLLLLLQGNASHGYNLIENLKEFDFTEVDPSVVYRNLRQMEEWGLVTSHWDTEGSGPSRRVYEITPRGEEFLRLSVEGLQNTRDRLDRFVKAYGERFEPLSERESKDEDLG